MEAQKNTKDSIFTGIFPSHEPLPPQEAVPHSYKPAVAEEQIDALNVKIESMERNIVGWIEKKLAEQVPPQPPSALPPELLSKITEMEASFKDFQEKLMLRAAQTKNTEESRISGRREIEELLKVVRDQQKYSELDRQMHDQLEKAWARVEEMEKRMMEVYSAAARKPAEPAVPAVSPVEIAAEVQKAVDARLEERLKPLETALKTAAAKIEAASAAAKKPAEIVAEVVKVLDAGLQERLAPLEALLKKAAVKIEAGPAAARSIEGRVAELSAAVDARLAGLSSEITQLRIDNFGDKERMGDILAEVKKDVLSSVREAFDEGSGAFIRHIDASAMDGRERIDAMVKLLISHMDELSARARDNALKIEALESCVDSENKKTLSAVSSMQYGLEKSFHARIEEAVDRLAAVNSGQLEKIKEAYGLSASQAPAVSAMAGSISEIEGRLVGVLAGLKAFIKVLEPVNLEGVLGVTGAIIRRSYASAGELVVGLEKETMLLARARGIIDTNLKNLALKHGGEEK